MNKFFKKALVTAAFAMSIGFAAYMSETNMPAVQAEADVSGGNAGGSTTTSGNSGSGTTTSGNSGSNTTTSGNSGSSTTTSGNSANATTAYTEAMQKATTVTATAADGTAVTVKVTAVTQAVAREAEQSAMHPAFDSDYYYTRDESAPFVTVDVAIEGAKPDGNVNVTLNHASIEAGATYVVRHKLSNGFWEFRVVEAGADGVLNVELSSLSPVSFYKANKYALSRPTDYNTNYNKDLEGQIGGTPEGGVIYITKNDGRNSLDCEMVKRIVDRDLTLVMEYTYNGADYRIVIPGKKAVIDESVPIYGPLYLAAHYSSNAAVGGSSDGVTYTIAKGDTLCKIAATNGTTVAALAVLNPQIKDVNVIYAGQTINLK